MKKKAHRDIVSREQWVKYNDLYQKIADELKISEFSARKNIIPHIINQNIKSTFKKLPNQIHELFAKELCVFPEQIEGHSVPTSTAWEGLDQRGMLLGYPVWVLWSDVFEALQAQASTKSELPITIEHSILLFDLNNTGSSSDKSSPEAGPEENNPRKRKPSGRNYAEADAPLIEEMRRMVSGGKSSSAWNAALAVVKRAAGGGTDESKAKRLSQRYSVQYGTEQD